MSLLKSPTKDFGTYIFFSPHTKGESGRRVFIDPGLLSRFVDVVDPRTLEGKQTCKSISELRNSAAGITSDSNVNHPALHQQVCGGLMVTYSLLQDGHDKSHGGGVYITNLQMALDAGRGDLPGLYATRLIERKWSAEKNSSKAIKQVVGAIGASLDKNKNAYEVALTANVFGDYFTRNINGKDLGNEFALYYSPGFVVDELGTWRTAEQKIARDGAGPEQLAEILLETQKQYWAGVEEPEHHWYVFEDGAKLLSRALSLIPSQGRSTLNCHRFEFLDPKANVGAILKRLDSLGAATGKGSKALGITSDHQASQLHQVMSGGDLVDGLQKHRLPAAGWDKKITPGSKFLVVAATKIQQDLKAGVLKAPTFQELYSRVASNLGNW
ncbi:hypothetical protein [Parendozoicomonas haliclonae]|uniref:Uncharacterized protein n=1 Tax=Parendozoicomonas haliclonae TaxID=1960125 RepID=A0A1X7AQZ0_9GAMM|nr:hypothetical protein [Parendozoicomonas haliclonae]SMA50655.1 hypothetical protein EHSB41UT_04472 [Parendozoicomonas haliclonae]